MTKYMTSLLTLTVLTLPSVRQTPAAAADELFADKNLQTAVRAQVFAKRNTDEPLTAEDVRNISTVTGKGMRIENLKGLEACTSLAALDLEDNLIADLTPLGGLKNLQTLTLAKNKINDLRPLAELTKLQYLQLEHNQLADISPLSKLVNLNSLYLSDNQIEDTSPLSDLKKLWSLYLGGNKIHDIKPLAKLPRLQMLQLERNQIEDVSPLRGMTDLNFLVLTDNRIADLGTLVEMAEKDHQGEMRFAPFWRLFLSGNPLSEEAKTKQISQLKEWGARITLEDKN